MNGVATIVAATDIYGINLKHARSVLVSQVFFFNFASLHSTSSAATPNIMEGGHHPLTHIYPNLLANPSIPRNFIPLHTAFDVAQLPPIPRILDLKLSLAARNVGHAASAFPNVMELALMGDTVLKTIIVERLQELTDCGRAGIVAVS